jgi:hypothetical protein
LAPTHHKKGGGARQGRPQPPCPPTHCSRACGIKKSTGELLAVEQGTGAPRHPHTGHHGRVPVKKFGLRLGLRWNFAVGEMVGVPHVFRCAWRLAVPVQRPRQLLLFHPTCYHGGTVIVLRPIRPGQEGPMPMWSLHGVGAGGRPSPTPLTARPSPALPLMVAVLPPRPGCVVSQLRRACGSAARAGASVDSPVLSLLDGAKVPACA